MRREGICGDESALTLDSATASDVHVLRVGSICACCCACRAHERADVASGRWRSGVQQSASASARARASARAHASRQSESRAEESSARERTRARQQAGAPKESRKPVWALSPWIPPVSDFRPGARCCSLRPSDDASSPRRAPRDTRASRRVFLDSGRSMWPRTMNLRRAEAGERWKPFVEFAGKRRRFPRQLAATSPHKARWIYRSLPAPLAPRLGFAVESPRLLSARFSSSIELVAVPQRCPRWLIGNLPPRSRMIQVR